MPMTVGARALLSPQQRAALYLASIHAVPAALDTPLSLRVSRLLFCDDILRLDDACAREVTTVPLRASGAGAPPPPPPRRSADLLPCIVQVVAPALGNTLSERSLALHMLPRLLRAALPGPGHGGPLPRSAWACMALLSPLAAVVDAQLSSPTSCARASFAGAQSAANTSVPAAFAPWLAPSLSALVPAYARARITCRAFSGGAVGDRRASGVEFGGGAGKPSPTHMELRAERAARTSYASLAAELARAVSVSNSLERDCCAVTRDLHAQLYGSDAAPSACSVPAPAGGAATAAPSPTSHTTPYPSAATCTAVASLLALLSALPTQYVPYCFATLAPLPAAARELDSISREAVRQALLLQLGNTMLHLLAVPAFPPAWVQMNVLVYKAACAVHTWMGAALATCYYGADAAIVSGLGNTGGTQPSSAASATVSAALMSPSWMCALPVWQCFVELSLALLTAPIATPDALSPGAQSMVAPHATDERAALCSVVRHVLGGSLIPALPSLRGGAAALGVLLQRFTASAYSDASGSTALTQSEACAETQVLGADAAQPVLPGLSRLGKLALAPQLIPVALDLTHSSSPDVCALARDVYFDLIAAELFVRYAWPGRTPPPARLLPANFFADQLASLTASADGGGGTSSTSGSAPVAGLPYVERFTIDAIDVLVQNHGPSLVTYATVAGSGSAEMAAGGSEQRGGSEAAQYVPPRENLIMSLFAPQQAQTRRTATAMGLGMTTGIPATPLLSALAACDATTSPATLPATAGAGVTTATASPAMLVLGSAAAPVVPVPPVPEGLALTSAYSSTSTSGGGSSGGGGLPVGAWKELLGNRIVLRFLSEIRTLYAMLSSVSQYPHTPAYEEERTRAALTLISYLRRTHRSDLYLKYVNYLHALHV
ncbi:MAG: hypothetical protein EOO41_01105, partial [Methanobacteriota archaeon]